MRVQVLAYSSVITTYLLIVIGGYVSASGSGDACGPDWPTCNGQIIPQLTGRILIEFIHRLFALLVGILITAMVLTVWFRYRHERTVLVLSTASFVSLIVQILLGMVTVRTELEPSIVAAHLGVASVVFGTVLVNAVAVRKIAQEGAKLLR